MQATPTEADLLNALAGLGGTILAVGDLMLDIFAYGTAARISPEAPIPVMRMTHETRMLGGVGNVARNVAALAGRTHLVASVGADERGDVLESLIADEARIVSQLLRCSDRQTTTKRRFVVAAQQMLRVDQEDTGPLGAADEARLIERIERLVPDASAVILSDYGKGTLSARVLRCSIDAARAAGVPILVDPKHRDMTRYAGATCITPNAGELTLATGLPVDTDEEVVAAATALLAACAVDYILATRSEKGMSLVARDGTALHFPARRREVFDVSGAGDTVISTLALAVAGGVPWPAAAGLANVAAGVVVGKQGTATCSIDELELEISESMLGLGAKLQTRAQAADLAARWRRRGLKVGFTNGCFDLLHPGHVTLLQRSRDACDRLIVGLNSDASVSRLKGPTRPLQNQAARAAVLSALASVDLVVIFDEDTPLELIKDVRPSVLLKGADYRIDQVVGADAVTADGGEVKLVDLVQGQSTTNIIRRMS